MLCGCVLVLVFRAACPGPCCTAHVRPTLPPCLTVAVSILGLRTSFAVGRLSGPVDPGPLCRGRAWVSHCSIAGYDFTRALLPRGGEWPLPLGSRAWHPRDLRRRHHQARHTCILFVSQSRAHLPHKDLACVAGEPDAGCWPQGSEQPLVSVCLRASHCYSSHISSGCSLACSALSPAALSPGCQAARGSFFP